MATTQTTHNAIQSNEEDLWAIAEVLSVMSSIERDKEYAEELQLREAIETTKLMSKGKSKTTNYDNDDDENEICSLFGNTNISDLYSFQASQLISVADTKYATETYYEIERREQKDHDFARKLQQFDEDGFDIDRIKEDEEMPDAPCGIQQFDDESSDTDQDEKSYDSTKEDEEDYDTIQETDNGEDYDTSQGFGDDGGDDDDDESCDTYQEVSYNNTSQEIGYDDTDNESEKISSKSSLGLQFKTIDSEDERSDQENEDSDKENEGRSSHFDHRSQKDESKRKREVFAPQTLPNKPLGIGAGTIGDHRCNSCYDKFSTFDLSADLDKMATSSANLGIVLDCRHGFCLACMKNYLNSVLKDDVVDFPIKCPLRCIDVNIGERIIEKSLTKEDLENYYLKMTVSSIKNKIYCPNKKCSAMIDYDHDESQPTYSLICPMCHESFCPLCRVSWHKDLTCEEYQALPLHERSPEDREVLNLAKNERWQRCPKCNMLVQLETGCNHITCRCKAEFCYVCGSDWDHETERCQKRCELWDETMLLEERTRRDLLVQQAQQAQNQLHINLLANRENEILLDSDDEDDEGDERVAYVNPVRVNPVRVNPAPVNPAPVNPAPVNRPPPPQPKQINRRLNINLNQLLIQHREQKRFRLSSWLIKMIEDSKCGYCNRRFQRVEDLESHLQRTTVHEVYECCGKLFRNEIDHVQHKGTIHMRDAQT
ncbi:E3 ubiquitin-protein ligase arih1 [Gigaspora margarita]|uniref:RBR-type E3 ubiquitin transferase n=1 Tax=Gigaspora margarita TaxID=4874 RepID=A0A8H3XAT3_GIGMA|nr:E3 ubiquitin-protein ligase arih1 [Gigaspora margarita]